VESVAATHCLDACAVIAYVRQEPGAEVLKALIERPTTFLAMHVCNLGEVYYDFFRADGLTAAQTAWTNTLALPLALRRDADDVVGPPWCAQRWHIDQWCQRVEPSFGFALRSLHSLQKSR
jgi:hypothetical protein